ncbi:hypothetical protein G7017_03845 [Pseudomonas fulva]|uniref:hypothetical protein n=1 Tax=Pseudomonas TaxID=286 RepID=UPI0015E2F34A|nr:MULTISPECIES: hypothetical protein [Pseudomonas]MBA1220036.1 hypothetical protein [Pseudomonas fulva]MDG9889235.1 hypothetical protein [Pseudomonas juntendi]
MNNFTQKHYLRCTQRFKEIVNEIGHRAGFVHLKQGQTYIRKKGFSALLDQIVNTPIIEIEGGYKEEIDKLNRVRVNHANNVSQLLNNVGHVSFQSNGKTYLLKDYIYEYYKSAEPALQFIARISETDPFYSAASLDLIEDLKEEAKNRDKETAITFKSSDIVSNCLALKGQLLDAVIYYFDEANVKARTLKLSESDNALLEKFKKIFEQFNSLNKYVNDALFKKQEPAYPKIAANLIALKKSLDGTNEKENDN